MRMSDRFKRRTVTETFAGGLAAGAKLTGFSLERLDGEGIEGK